MRSILIPKYLEEFRCIGGACEDTCCAGWNITIDKKTYQTYRKVRNPEISDDLKQYVKRNRKANNDVEYAKFILDENQNCKMMLDDGLCSIHKELGEEFLCNTCAIYPRHLTKVGESIEKSLTLSCPEAARIVLLREDGLDFIETEEPKNTRGLIANELKLENHPYFWDLRIFTIQLLQSRQQSLEIRLIILGLFFQKIEQLKRQELAKYLPEIMKDYLNRLDDVEFIESLKNIDGNLNFQINITRGLIRYRLSGGYLSEKYIKILENLLKGLEIEDKETFEIENAISNYRYAFNQYYEPFINKKGYILENYIVNYVFKNLFPYDYNSLFESYMMLIIHFNLIKLHLIGMAAKQKKLDEQMVIECIQQLSKVIEHNPSYLEGVREGMKESDYNTMAHMFVMIKS